MEKSIWLERFANRYPPQRRIERAGHEMKQNPPKILAHTARKFGAAQADRQRVAIMLSKARRGA